MTEPHAADLLLVQRVLQHDAEAKAILASRLACVGRMLAGRNRDFGSPLLPDELDDVAGDVVARVCAKLADYAGAAKLESWVYAFCEGELRNAVRRKRRRLAREAGAAADELPGPTLPEPQEDVHLCVDALPTFEQQLVRWKFFDGLTLEAISERTHSKLNTTKSRYFRLLATLRACLERRGGSARR